MSRDAAAGYRSSRTRDAGVGPRHRYRAEQGWRGRASVVTVRTDRGVFVVDARSRTECEMLWSGVYDEDDIDFLHAATPADGVFIDVGANVGLIFIPVWRSVTTGRAIAVEPVPVNFERLTAARLANEPTAREPTLLNIALGANPGVLRLVKEGFGQTRPTTRWSHSRASPVSRSQSRPSTPLARRSASSGSTRSRSTWRASSGRSSPEDGEPSNASGRSSTASSTIELMPRRGKTSTTSWAFFEPLGYR